MNDLIITNDEGKQIASLDDKMVKTIQENIVKGGTEEDLIYFMNVAKNYGLNPFTKEIYAMKVPNKKTGKDDLAIMVSRDGYVKIAKNQRGFEKLQSNVVYENDDFNLEWDGLEVANLSHKHGAKDRGKVIGAWAGIKYRGQKPVYVYVPYRDYKKSNKFWTDYSSAMIRKVAEKEACRLGAGVTGLYIEEEMPIGYSLNDEANEPRKSKVATKESKKEPKNTQEAEYTKKESKKEEPPITDVTPPESELEIEQEQTIRENKVGNKAINRLIEKGDVIGKDNLVDEVRNMLGEKVISPAEAGKAQKVIANP